MAGFDLPPEGALDLPHLDERAANNLALPALAAILSWPWGVPRPVLL
jgi:hypothetical protein